MPERIAEHLLVIKVVNPPHDERARPTSVSARDPEGAAADNEDCIQRSTVSVYMSFWRGRLVGCAYFGEELTMSVSESVYGSLQGSLLGLDGSADMLSAAVGP